MNSKCCGRKAIKQYSGIWFCSECISICSIRVEKKYYMYLFLITILFININCYAPKSYVIPIKNIKSVHNAYELDPLNIEFIESKGNHRAISIRDAKGIMQITDVVLHEYNVKNNTNYNSDNLFNIQINKKIAKWYIEKRIPELLKSKNLEINLSNILICYNAGINYAVIYNKSKNINDLPEETRNYLIKYITLM